jgi:Tfp pilus assembly protein PilZ/CheY-like chemotaxis protein
VPLLRAVLVDRDPLLLRRLTSELSRSGFVVEALASTVGLTPDLLERSHPDLLLLDNELPEIKHGALVVLIRSTKARRPLKVVVSTEREPLPLVAQLAADLVIRRSQLAAEGARALGISLPTEGPVDVRAIIDEVLGRNPGAKIQVLEVRIDLFSKANFYLGRDKAIGLFVPTADWLPVGQRVEVQLDLMGRQQILVKGEVAWQRPYGSFGGRASAGLGIAPDEMPEAQRKVIEHFLETRPAFSAF